MAPRTTSASPDLDSFSMDDLEAELRRLSDINRQLLNSDSEGSIDYDAEPTPAPAPPSSSAEAEALRQENADLRRRLAQLEAARAADARAWEHQRRQAEAVLEEKSELIRQLNAELQQLREQVTSASTGRNLQEELEQLRAELQEQKIRMAEDEEVMMAQMREMEMSMARDRAEIARQRLEVVRNREELAHDIELVDRDDGLRNRLRTIRGNGDAKARAAAEQDTPVTSTPSSRPKSGFLARLFG